MKNKNRKWGEIILKIVLSIIALVIIAYFVLLLIVFLPDSEIYNRLKFKREIKKDDRFEKLFHLELISYDKSRYDIGIKLKDGRKIRGRVSGSIYGFIELQEIGNYKINALELWYNGQDSTWNLYYNNGISTEYLKPMIGKPLDYYFYNLNEILYHYDEIIEFLKKIDNEEPIPGVINKGWNIDTSGWGNEEELKKYIGYYSKKWNPNTIQLKVYVEYIGKD
jgi:hypothetical protein